MKPVSFVQNAVISIQAPLDVTNACEEIDLKVCPGRGPPLKYASLINLSL